jgi:hypothetical protein
MPVGAAVGVGGADGRQERADDGKKTRQLVATPPSVKTGGNVVR